MRQITTLSRISILSVLKLSLIVGFYLSPVSAEPSSVVLVGESVRLDFTEALEQVQDKIKEIEGTQGLEESQKKKLLELYRLAKERLQAAKSYEESAHVYQEATETAPAQIEKLSQQLAHFEADKALADLQRNEAKASLPELEQQLTQARTRLATLESTLASLDKQLQEQQSRPRQAREQLTEAKQRLERVEKDLKGPLPADESPLLAEAHRIALQARVESYLGEIRMLEQELLSYAVRLQLLTAQRDLATQWVSQAQAGIKSLQELIIQRRELEVGQAKAATARAEQEAAGKHPAIQQLAEQNARLSEEMALLVADLGRATAQREAMEAQLNQTEQAFKSTQQRLEIVGLNEALQQVLQDQRRSLPELSYYRQEVRRYSEEIAQVGLDQLRIDEQRRHLSQLDEAVNRVRAAFQMVPRLPQDQRQQIEAEVRSLLKEQQALLDKLKTAQSQYLRALGDLDFTLQQLIDTVQQYKAFLDDRLLWIPSASPLGINTLPDLLTGAGWLLSPGNWLDTARGLWAIAVEAPLLILPTLLAFIGLLLVRSNLRQSLETTGARTTMPYADRFGFTIRALIVTLLAAAPWPVLLGVTGRLLWASVEVPEFGKAVGAGLMTIALPLFLMHGFHLLCREDGVAKVHFGWRPQVVALWRRNLSWAIPVVLPALFITAMAQVKEAYVDSLGRVGFIVSMMALAIFFQRLLRSKEGIVEQHLEEYPTGWLARFRYGWYSAIVGFPLALAGLAAVGYFYTALQLKGGLIATLRLLLLAALAQALVIRWLRVAQRKLALVKLREKREAERRVTPSTREATSWAGELDFHHLDFHHIDIETVDVQTRQLLRMAIGVSVAVGLWFVWAPTLSALGILDDVILWQRTVVVEGQEVQRPFTLANLALALAVALIAMGAARNLPGFLEIAVLKRLSLAPGSRYAVTALARYAIGIAGILLVFEAIGGSWSQIQWLVAALTVGLGFGLQEIFANFVSGLIILFERPVRVGDVVTVGDISGTISRIRIRATTVTDFDHKELIVPNKSFITEKVVNWTLSDSITRITLNVRIAYGSDTALAHQIILDAVKAHSLVLQEPVPDVYFVGFGESALNFVVWAFVKELGNRFPLIHELNTNINRTLREQGIEIPLPQRDIHVRSSPPSALVLEKFNPKQEAGQAPSEASAEAPLPESQEPSPNTRGGPS